MEVSVVVKSSPPWKREKIGIRRFTTEHMSKYKSPKEQKRLKIQNRGKRATSF